MAPQKHSSDVASQISFREPIEDPPPYTSLDTISSIESIQTIIDRFLSHFERDAFLAEDARRSLAQSFPSTDVPYGARLAEANAWIVEQNDWLIKAKGSHGCATHELAIPPLTDFEDPLNLTTVFEPYEHETIASAKSKATAATAVHRGAKIIARDQELIQNKSIGSKYIEATDKWHRARIVFMTANVIATIYGNTVPWIIAHRSSNQTFEQKRAACVLLTWSSDAVAVAAVYVTTYQLFLARENAQSDAIIATDKAVRALAVYLTARSVFERSSNELKRLDRPPYPIKSNLMNIRRWISNVIAKTLHRLF